MAELLTIRDPYATIWVATYEPLIVSWLSFQGLADLDARLLAREAPGKEPPSRTAPTLARFAWSSHRVRLASAVDRSARVAAADPDVTARAAARQPVMPTAASRALGPSLPEAERTRRRELIRTTLWDDALSVDELVKRLSDHGIPILTGPRVHRELSPVGVAYLYRQLFFDAGAGVGPLEQVVAVAPNETVEISQEVTRRRTIEIIETFGNSQTSESETTEQVTDEISEQLQNSITSDTSLALSANAEGSIGVWSAGASFAADISSSRERSMETTRRHLISRTRRSAQIVQRTHSLSVRSVTDISDRSLLRRVVRNDTAEPVNYALRRVMRRVRVKVQSMGPRLVWQVYVCRPSQRLARSRMVMFREADPTASPGMPPNAPPEPQGGVEAGTQTVAIEAGHIILSIPRNPERETTAVTVDSLYDPSPEGKEPKAPVLTGEAPVSLPGDPAFDRWQFAVDRGTASSASVNFTVTYRPSAQAIAKWQEQVAAARADWESAQRDAEFERAKKLIEAKMRVPSRPASDLRTEERYEILNRLISEGFQHAPGRTLPLPVEIELFHRYFDVAALFYFVHPSWWEPRYTAERGEYEITDESDPAPLGSSLGWVLQLDGDKRRNEFLNSPWVRVCMPVRPEMEREALQWLAQHIEGTRGFSLDANHPVGKLLAELEERRSQEATATPGPDYITLDGEIAPGREPAVETYPIIDEFEILQPTDGFVYEKITIGS